MRSRFAVYFAIGIVLQAIARVVMLARTGLAMALRWPLC